MFVIKQTILIPWIVAISMATAGCATITESPDLKHTLQSIPAKNLSSYAFDPDSSLLDRVQKAPKFLLDFLKKSVWYTHYNVYLPSHKDLRKLENNLSLLPRTYLNILNERLVGIYFIENLTGGGMINYILNEDYELFFALIINPEVLRHNISDWMTYKEMSFYIPVTSKAPDIRVNVDCGNKYSGLIYVLYHETSHIVDYMMHCTPYVNDNMRELGLGVAETPFSTSVWKEYDIPSEGNDFPQRKKISLYNFGQEPAIPISAAIKLYQALSKTPFSSVYAARNWADDFAEYMTWYCFTQVLDQPYTIEVLHDDKVEYRYSPMESELVLKRADLILKFLD